MNEDYQAKSNFDLCLLLFFTKRNNCWETLKVTNEHLIPMKSITFYSSFYCQAKNNFEMMSEVFVLKSFRFIYE